MLAHPTRIAIIVASVALVFGCSKKSEGGDTASETETETGTATDNTAPDKGEQPTDSDKEPAGDEKPATEQGTPEEQQCKRILEKSWGAIQPILARVGVDPTKKQESYKNDKNFIERCAKRDAEKRDCMEKADNPVVAIHDCGANPPGAKPSEKLWAPDITSRDPREKLPQEKQDELMAAMTGTWVSDWKSFGQKTTWKIAKTGEVEATMVRKGKTEKKDLKFSFPEKGAIKVQTTPTSSQYYSFLPVDKKTFLASSNGAYDAFEVEDKDKFLFYNRFDWMAKDGDKCSVITNRGVELDAECKWSKKGKTPVLTFKYKKPGNTRSDGTPIESESTYHYIAGHMVDERMVDIGTFKKK